MAIVKGSSLVTVGALTALFLCVWLLMEVPAIMCWGTIEQSQEMSSRAFTTLSWTKRGNAVLRNLCYQEDHWVAVVPEEEMEGALSKQSCRVSLLSSFFARNAFPSNSPYWKGPERFTSSIVIPAPFTGEKGLVSSAGGGVERAARERFVALADPLFDRTSPSVVWVPGLTYLIEQMYRGYNIALFSEKTLAWALDVVALGQPSRVIVQNHNEYYTEGLMPFENGLLWASMELASAAATERRVVQTPAPSMWTLYHGDLVTGLALARAGADNARVQYSLGGVGRGKDGEKGREAAVCFEELAMFPHVVQRYPNEIEARRIRNLVSDHLSLHNKSAITDELPLATRGKPFSVVLVHRASTRRIVNEAEIVSLLTSFGYTVKVVDWQGTDLARQFLDVCNAQLLVAMHGAALNNLIFLPPSAGVIEIAPFSIDTLTRLNLWLGNSYMAHLMDALPIHNKFVRYRQLSRARGLRHDSLVASAPPNYHLEHQRVGMAPDDDGLVDPQALLASLDHARFALSSLGGSHDYGPDILAVIVLPPLFLFMGHLGGRLLHVVLTLMQCAGRRAAGKLNDRRGDWRTV